MVGSITLSRSIYRRSSSLEYKFVLYLSILQILRVKMGIMRASFGVDDTDVEMPRLSLYSLSSSHSSIAEQPPSPSSKLLYDTDVEMPRLSSKSSSDKLSAAAASMLQASSLPRPSSKPPPAAVVSSPQCAEPWRGLVRSLRPTSCHRSQRCLRFSVLSQQGLSCRRLSVLSWRGLVQSLRLPR